MGEATFCKNCPMEREIQVFCKNCFTRQLKKLDEFLPKDKISLGE